MSETKANSEEISIDVSPSNQNPQENDQSPINSIVPQFNLAELYGIDDNLTAEELLQLEILHLQDRNGGFSINGLSNLHGVNFFQNGRIGHRNGNELRSSLNNNNNLNRENDSNLEDGVQRNRVMAQNLASLFNQDNNQSNDPIENDNNENPENPENNENGGSRSRIASWKTMVDVYFICSNIAIIMAMMMDPKSKSECSNQKLRRWCIGQIMIQFLLIFFAYIVNRIKQRSYGMTPERRQQITTMTNITSKIMNAFWICWVIVGIVWTFQESKICVIKGNSVFLICYILTIWHLVLLACMFLGCVCSVNFMIIYICRHKNSQNKASNKMIKNTTTQKVYKEGLVPKEDCTCAICLSDYEEGDKLRFLRCEHHFHSDCIVQWLKKNKSCPFCKREIDSDVQKELKSESKTKSELISESENETEIESTNEQNRATENQRKEEISEANDVMIHDGITEEEEQEIQLIRRS